MDSHVVSASVRLDGFAVLRPGTLRSKINRGRLTARTTAYCGQHKERKWTYPTTWTQLSVCKASLVPCPGMLLTRTKGKRITISRCSMQSEQTWWNGAIRR